LYPVIEDAHERLAPPVRASDISFCGSSTLSRAREPGWDQRAQRRAPGGVGRHELGRRRLRFLPPISSVAPDKCLYPPNLIIKRRKGRARGARFLPAKPITRVIGTFDPAPDAGDVSSSPFVRHYASTGSKISALSQGGAWRKPGHRRLLQRDMQHGEVMKSLLGGELVAHSLNSSGQDRGDFA
jgi:hypothetical protein